MQICPKRSFYVELPGSVQLKSLFRPIFFAFKYTMSRHFAGSASVAIETIWIHEPRDLIFLGPFMTLLCLSRYSSRAQSAAPQTSQGCITGMFRLGWTAIRRSANVQSLEQDMLQVSETKSFR